MKTDIEFLQSASHSGKMYGYPQCCIDYFLKQPPSYFARHRQPSKADNLRFRMSHINGKYTGFIPCLKHAIEIKNKKIRLADLIKNRQVLIPFPNDWSHE